MVINQANERPLTLIEALTKDVLYKKMEEAKEVYYAYCRMLYPIPTIINDRSSKPSTTLHESSLGD
jgi:hypothetical protein